MLVEDIRCLDHWERTLLPMTQQAVRGSRQRQFTFPSKFPWQRGLGEYSVYSGSALQPNNTELRKFTIFITSRSKSALCLGSHYCIPQSCELQTQPWKLEQSGLCNVGIHSNTQHTQDIKECSGLLTECFSQYTPINSNARSPKQNNNARKKSHTWFKN